HLYHLSTIYYGESCTCNLLLAPNYTLFTYTTLFRSKIEANYFAKEQELNALVKGVRICREILNQSAMTAFNGGEERPGADLKSRSEEHTSELQSRENLVCRLLLEKKKIIR